jgi:NADPH-dependent glutamate synthase beta subunit-like oxidoreductase
MRTDATMTSPTAEAEAFHVNPGPANSLFQPPPLHHERHLSIIVVGSGPSGLLLAYKLQRTFKSVTLKIFEQNADVGGAWLTNNYPG